MKPMQGDVARVSTLMMLSCVSLLWGSTAIAGLKDKPPKTFDATTTGAWQIDPARSDDPKLVLDKAREKTAADRATSGRFTHGSHGGDGNDGGSRGGGRGGFEAAGGPLLGDLASNPSTLRLERTDLRVKVFSGEYSTSCEAGGSAIFSDSLGNGERRCGWNRSAWVVETTRGNSFKRTDIYEPDVDGKTLTYMTTVSGSRIPKVTISRTYVRAGK